MFSYEPKITTSRANKNPALAIFKPFLNNFALGKNIKKAETTKNSNTTPKVIFNTNSGLLVVALCKLTNFLSTSG